MRSGSDRAWKKRLELLKNAVLSGIENCNIADSTNKTNELHKLRTITQRFIEEVRLFMDKISEEEVEEYTNVQLEAEFLTAIPPLPDKENNTKLPKLELPKFQGDILKWTEFYDRFISSVDTKNISNADKLTYLQAALEGDALATIRGIDITNENYTIAMGILKERYGKPGSVLNAHYTAIIGLKCASSNARNCLETFNVIERHLRVLKAMGEDINHNNLRTIILSKFPNDLLYELRMRIKTDDESIENIRKELEHLISARMVTQNQQPAMTIEALHVRERVPKYKRPFNSNVNEKNINIKRKRLNPCIFCQSQGHFNDMCTTVVSVNERKKRLKGKCYICLGNHMAKDCFRKKPCFHCKGLHNSAICLKKEARKEKGSGTHPSSSIMHINSKQQNNHVTILQTAITTIKGNNYRLLFDTGSQRSYITTRAFEELKLHILEDTVLTVYTFGSEKAQEIESPTTEMKLQNIKLRLNVVPFITTGVKCPKLAQRKNMQNVKLADDGSCGSQIDILIGNDYYHSFIYEERKQYDDHLYLIKSVFGWIWSGIQHNIDQIDEQLSLVTYVYGKKTGTTTEIDLPLRENYVHKFWDLETIGIRDCPKTTRDDQAVTAFNKSVLFINKRYWIKWPWSEFPPQLPVNYALAFGRLVSLVRRLDSLTLKEYNNIILNQLQNNIIEIVNTSVDKTRQDASSQPIHYLPHHAIKQPGKKVRIVYDASSKTKGQNSLNDCMYKGPLLLEDLIGLLLRFRTHKYGIMADIEKAFLQLGIQESDRDVTRFLWLKDINQNPCTDNLLHFRFCRVPFGIACSPFLLAIVIKHHMMQLNTETSKIVDQDLYVDNLITGKDTTQECIEFYKEVRKIFESLSMNIREWYSNDKTFTEYIEKELIGSFPANRGANSLGLNWNPENDTLHLNIKMEIPGKAINKREVLRQLASIFDPCGFVSPLLLRPKLFLQRLWKEKLDWDSVMPDEMQNEWKDISKDLRLVKDVEIPRWCGVTRQHNYEELQQELHVFADASAEAYAAVVYLRIKQANDVKVTMLMSKSRLTPLKDRMTHTIPRLELLAVLIGCRLLNYVRKSLNINVTAQYIWTDSQIVLCWLDSTRVLPPFVNARIQEIKKTTETKFKYVPSKLNPADLATRPCLSLTYETTWKYGPEFLKQDNPNWPKPKQEHVMLYNDNVTLNDKDMHLIKELQNKYFAEEMLRNTNLSKTLGLYIDEGILRCRGRFKNTDWTVGQKYPILLPKDTDFTKEIILKTHKRMHHAGVAQTLANIRLTFWIPHGRSQVQKILKQCKPCKKYGGGPYQNPPTPALPKERVEITPPFTYVGIDYLGPLYVTSGDEPGHQIKLWICLFTCLVIRAVHLEVVKDLSAEECMMALRRFVADRRVPKKILSDNAANFKLTAEIMKSEYCTENRLEWSFIPELAPWYGGAYERLVGLVKHCLKRTIDKHILTESQLTTIIKEIEAVVNNRPLTTVSSDIEHILTPADFLRAGGLLTIADDCEPIHPTTTIKKNLVDGWKKGQKILQEFMKMFQHQYLASLRERSNVKRLIRGTSKEIPKVGDLVQIKDTTPRVKWKVGKISQLIESRDGENRVAIVRLDTGDMLRRSVTHLYPLEIDLEEEIENEKEQENTRAATSIRKELLGQEIYEMDTELAEKDNTQNIEDTRKSDSEKEDSILRTEQDISTKDVELTDNIMSRVTNTENEVPKKRKAAREAARKMSEWLKLLLIRNNI